MTDTQREEVSLHPAWDALGRRLGVAAGAAVALVSLAQGVPVWLACLRGAACFLVARWVARAGLFALEQGLRSDAAAGRGEEEPERT